MKPKLKAPGTELLKQKCDDMLSTSAFRFNLRRYNMMATRVQRSCFGKWVDMRLQTRALAKFMLRVRRQFTRHAFERWARLRQIATIGRTWIGRIMVRMNYRCKFCAWAEWRKQTVRSQHLVKCVQNLTDRRWQALSRALFGHWYGGAG